MLGDRSGLADPTTQTEPCTYKYHKLSGMACFGWHSYHHISILTVLCGTVLRPDASIPCENRGFPIDRASSGVSKGDTARPGQCFGTTLGLPIRLGL